MKKLRNWNKDYCGECLTCEYLMDDLKPTEELLEDYPKIYRALYDNKVCLTTKNKLARDKRYRNNIRVEERY